MKKALTTFVFCCLCSSLLLAQQPTLLKDIRAGLLSGFEEINDTEKPFILNGVMYFAANNGTLGHELWRTDGTSAGTYIVTDINPGAASANPQDFFNYNGSLVFIAERNGQGQEIWISDGTFAGTNLLKDINEGADGCSPNDFVIFNGSLYFSAHNGFKAGLWKSDGTQVGTTLVTEINVRNQTLSIINNKLVFGGEIPQDDFGRELWVSDGTSEGTLLLKDIYSGSHDSKPENFYKVGNQLFFTINDPLPAIWKTDGTPNGTQKVKDIALDNQSEFVVFQNQLFFTSDENDLGYELWKTDGTDAGTVLVKDISPMMDGINEGSDPTEFLVHNGSLYFIAEHPEFGRELWISDGTNEGTQIFIEIEEGELSSIFSTFPLTAIGNDIYFTASPESLDMGNELWKTDGTAEGTQMIADLYEGEEGSSPNHLTLLGNRLLFIAESPAYGRELWSYSEDDLVGLSSINETHHSLKIYPNPTADFVFIELENEVKKDGLVQIKNTAGQIILEQQLNKNNLVSLSSLKNGLYFLEYSDGLNVWVKKVLVQN